MNTRFNKLIQKSIPYLFIFLIAYIIATVIFIILPKNGVDYIEKSTSFLEYKKFDGFYSKNSIKVKAKVKKENKDNQKTLVNYNLKAIYSTVSNSGWITIVNKRTQKSYILSQFEDIDGYVLTRLYKDYVIMEKVAKEYRLDIKQANNKLKELVSEIEKDTNINIIEDASNVKIKRSYLNSYINDIDKIWENIQIQEIRKNSKIEGFEVKRIQKNSAFTKLGLKKNDVIKSINNNTLESYEDAFKVYNNINNIKYLNIEVLRNNEIVELNYEID